MNRAAVFGAVVGALWAAHDVADHVLQTDEQAARKASSWSAMGRHVGGYHLVQALTLLALRPLGVRPSWQRAAAAVAVSAGTHAVLDRRWPVVRLLELTGSRKFASPTVTAYGLVRQPVGAPLDVDVFGRLPLHGPYLADQALHHGVLTVCAAIIAGGAR